MIQFNSALLALASDFRGRFAPFEAIGIAPHPQKGVFVAATDNGSTAIIGFDPNGTADAPAALLPGSELIRASRGIKTAPREITVNLEERRATVTTYRKSNNETKEFPILEASAPFPPLHEAVAFCLEHWKQEPPMSITSGRYSTRLLAKAAAAAEDLGDSLCLSGFSGGPLRLDVDGISAVILLMPQTAKTVTPPPAWLDEYVSSTRRQGGGCDKTSTSASE